MLPVACYVLLVLMFVVCCLRFVCSACCALCAVCRVLLFDVWCSLLVFCVVFVVRCSSCAVRCVLFVGCCLLVVV